MDRKDIRIGILRIEGTNCEEESARAFRHTGATADIVHLKQLLKDGVLARYHGLMLPGGFSSGDYVRAGAIFAARMKSALGAQLVEFVDSGKPVLGVCNGFQILVEIGILPGLGGTMTDTPEAVLTTNDSARFECRPAMLEHVPGNRSIFTRHLGRETVMIPVAHAEGKFMLPAERSDEMLGKMKDNGQVVFRYIGPDGSREYPWNPNGSVHDIAGICNPAGNVLGMMPHPERVLYRNRLPDWTRRTYAPAGPGIFESAVSYIEENW